MRPRRLSVLLFLLLLLTASLQCRRAEGVASDPMDQEATAALRDYLRIDTSNPPGNESAGARFLQQLFAREGIAAQLVGNDPSRQGLYVRLGSRSGNHGKPGLMLLSHIDVVPAIAPEWTRPPFGGVEAGGYLWGRGALDIKSLTIAWAMALIEIKRRGLPLERDLVFLAVPDEEAGGLRGSKMLLEMRPELFQNVGFVLNEGGYNETVVDRVRFWGIEVQQKVPLWVRLRAKGTPGHAAAPPDDGGSVAKLVRVLERVDRIETPMRLTPDVERYFHAAGATRKDERGEVLRNISAEIGGPRIDRVLSPAYRSLLQDTVTITHLSAGTSVNSIPANAMAEVDIRLLPDQPHGPMLEKLRVAAGSDADLEILLSSEPGPTTSTETELFALLRRKLTEAEPGSHVAATVGGGATDSRFFRARGIVAYGVAPFKVNYYDAGTAHGNDERIRGEFFVEGVRLARSLVTEFCAGANSSTARVPAAPSR